MGASISMAGLWPLIGKRLYGEVGYDVVKPFVVEIDYARRLITLYDPEVFRYAGSGVKFPVHMLGRYDPQIDGELVVPGQPPIPVRFTLDTGAGGTIVAAPLVDKHRLLDAVGRSVSTQDRGVGGAEPSEVMARISRLQIGPYAVEKPLVALSRDRFGSLANEAISVNMGGNILRRFTVVIDYAHQWVALEPNRHFAEPFLSDASGLLLTADGGDFRSFVVQSIVAGSPAGDAGLMKGDVIAAINGKPAKSFALWEFEETLKTPDAAVKLSVRRGDETLTRTLRLRSLI